MIPDGWTLVRLGDLGLFSKGKGIKKDDVVSDGLPCVRYGQLYTDHDSWIRGFTAFINRETALESRRLASGELLFTGSGETADEIGKCVAFLGVEEAYAGGDIVILTPKNVDSKFMGYALNAPDVVQQKIQRAQGDAVVHISASSLASLQVNLPPLEEQQAIAEALSDADALVESLDALIAKKRDMKQAAMQQLLTGRTRLPGFTGEWSEVQLGDIGKFSKGQGIKKDEVVASGLPCVRYGQIYTDHNDWIRSFTAFISPTVALRSRRLQSGELLFTGSGETANEIGKCVAFLGNEEAYAGGDIVILTPTGVDAKFMGYALNTPALVQQKVQRAQGDAVVHISASNLATLKVLLPVFEEQQVIAEVLSDMDAEIDALIARREKADLVKQGMMQELLSGRVRLV